MRRKGSPYVPPCCLKAPSSHIMLLLLINILNSCKIVFPSPSFHVRKVAISGRGKVAGCGRCSGALLLESFVLFTSSWFDADGCVNQRLEEESLKTKLLSCCGVKLLELEEMYCQHHCCGLQFLELRNVNNRPRKNAHVTKRQVSCLPACLLLLLCYTIVFRPAAIESRYLIATLLHNSTGF